MINFNIPVNSPTSTLRNRLKMLFKNIILFISVCIILTGAFEIFLRFYPLPYSVKIKNDKIILPEGVQDIKTYMKDKSDKIDAVIVKRRNSLGFRGEEPPFDFNSHLTIMAVGGSTTFNFFIPDGKTWIDVLGSNLNNNFRGFWINNAGFDGMTTHGHIALMHNIIKLRPKLVLFLVGINDLGHPGDIGLHKEWRKKQEEWGKEVSPDAQLSFIKNILIVLEEIPYLKAVKKSISREVTNSEIYSLVLNIQRNLKAYEMKLPTKLMDFNELQTIVIDDNDREIIRNRMQDEKSRAILWGYENRLKKLIQISRNNGIEPVFITQPALFGKATDDVTKIDLAKISIYESIIMDGELKWEWLETFNDVTRNVASSNNVFLIDLASNLPKSSRYYIDLHHHSNEGNKKIAEILYGKLCPYLAGKYSDHLIENCAEAIK